MAPVTIAQYDKQKEFLFSEGLIQWVREKVLEMGLISYPWYSAHPNLVHHQEGLINITFNNAGM